MRYTVSDFVNLEKIEVVGDDYTDNKGIGERLVTIQQRGGSMSFHHAMNITQARELAAALIACCEELEAV